SRDHNGPYVWDILNHARENPDKFDIIGDDENKIIKSKADSINDNLEPCLQLIVEKVMKETPDPKQSKER
ncbi:MAG: hypothetical protein KJ846_02135, partial [Proteobacteria bacterium]|nr:hypothetical protein [Pseudomonadota bacterium]